MQRQLAQSLVCDCTVRPTVLLLQEYNTKYYKIPYKIIIRYEIIVLGYLEISSEFL